MLGEQIGVGETQPRLALTSTSATADRFLEQPRCFVALTHVVADAGLDEDDLHLLRQAELEVSRLPEGSQRGLMLADGPFAIGDDRQVVVVAGNPVQRSVFGERRVVVPSQVGGLGRRLANNRQSGREPPGDHGMRERLLGIDVEELGRRLKMASDLVGQLLGQRAKLGTNAAGQTGLVVALGQLGLVLGRLQPGWQRTLGPLEAIVVAAVEAAGISASREAVITAAGIGVTRITVRPTVVIGTCWTRAAPVAVGLTIPVTRRPLITITIRFAIPVTVGFAIPITVRPAVTVGRRPLIPITIRLAIPITVGFTVTIAVGFTVTIARRPLIPITIRLAIPVTVGLTIPITIRLAIPVTVGLTIAIAIRLTIAVARRPLITVAVRLAIPVTVGRTGAIAVRLAVAALVT